MSVNTSESWSDEEVRVQTRDQGYPLKAYKAEAIGNELLKFRGEIKRLRLQLNMPVTDDFLEGVKREAAHQRERWGVDHDAGKTDADWFWLVGYLAGKALHLPEKRLHHCISAAAALFNWFLFAQGKTNMRPGIEPPAGEPR